MSATAPAVDKLATPIGGGIFIAVVGPSGAGKDTVIGYTRDRASELARPVRFIRRVITRTVDAASEDHDTLSEAEFAAAERGGAFAVAWPAHGLRYGLPADTDDVVSSGSIAVANVSRAAIPALRTRYVNVVVVNITASREVLANRLAMRGRETDDEILARLDRSVGAAVDDAVEIRNDGAPQEAGEAFLAVLRDWIERL